MANFNRVILVGNLTRDVELRYTPGGTPVTDISIAVNERIKRNEEWVEETSYFDVTIWGRTAEVAGQYLSKGRSVLIEGRLKQDRWEQDGQKRSKVKIICEKMQMLSGTGGDHGSSGHSASDHGEDQMGGQRSSGGASPATASAHTQPGPSGDVPF